MKKELYVDISDGTLVSFIRNVFPNTHTFMQDNDLKHTSRYAASFILSSGITWWKTPAESPDFNPIGNMWHELREFIRQEVKLKTKAELVDGIVSFWNTVDDAKCTRYIRHLRKVIPRAIELNGDARGY